MTAFLAHADIDNNGSVNSTGTFYALGSVNPVSPDLVRDHAVHALSVALKDPSAVVEVTFGRIELSEAHGATGGRFYRANRQADNIAGLGAVSPAGGAFAQVLGRYFLSGGQPLQLAFPEPIEAIADYMSSTDTAFAVHVRNVAPEGYADFHLNIDFEVRQ